VPLNDRPLFEFELFLINLFINKIKGIEWEKEKENDSYGCVLFDRDKFYLK
jgi:hypothetical protein